jgi:molybdopterin/thiamine biosynthesis adenylyltransferase
MSTLAITTEQAACLFDALQLVDETAWVLVARVADDGGLLLGRDLLDVPAAAYIERGPRRLTIASAGFVPAFSAARRDGAIPIFIHTHPGGDASRSSLDEHVDELLRSHAADRGLSGYASLIVGGTPSAPEITGRLWMAHGRHTAVRRLRLAGNNFRLLLANSEDADSAPPSIFDRQVRAFGEVGQRLLAELRVGVVGAGGTGSASIEQLARLGVGTIVVVDDDTIDKTNVTRIHESVEDDVGESKAVVATRRAQSYGTGTKVHTVDQTVCSRAGVEALAGCDVIFGCTDDNAGRLVINRLAYRYLVPVIDCGVVVDVSEVDLLVRGVVGRVTVVAPGEPCLLCRGQVDTTLASEEMMDPDTRRARAGEGYARGAQAPAPAVVTFTTAIAAMAVNEMLGRLFGYMDSPSSQTLIRFHDQAVGRGGRRGPEGHTCRDAHEWGLGPTEPLLGIVGLG